MTVKELIDKLLNCDPKTEVEILYPTDTVNIITEDIQVVCEKISEKDHVTLIIGDCS